MLVSAYPENVRECNDVKRVPSSSSHGKMADLGAQPLSLPGSESPAARWFLGEAFRVSRQAHHPLCRCYDNHLLRFGRYAVCLGCACMGAGAVATGAVLAWLSSAHFATLAQWGVWRLVALGVAFYLPALAQPFVQKKTFKVVSRFLLGMAVSCLWFAALVLLPRNVAGMALRGVFVVVFWATWRATQRFPRPDAPTLRALS